MIVPPIFTSDLDEILHATAPLWPELRNRRLFLTGGTGFFGAWLVESFLHIDRALSLKASMTVLSRSPEAFLSRLPHLRNQSSLSFVEGDVRTFAYDEPHDYVIHAATAASAKQMAEAPDEMFSTIMEGTRNVLHFAARAKTRKLLFISSGAVYGPQPPTLANISEDYPCLPNTAYGKGKLAAEQLLAEVSCEAKIARCFAFLGPHLPLDTHFAAGNFLADALARRNISIASDGCALRSYLYPTDLCIWLWTLLFRGSVLRPYNAGSDVPVSIRTLAEAIRDQVTPGLAIHIAQAPSDGHPPRYVPSVDRAREELALTQTVTLEEAIRRTAAWHRLK